MSDEAHHEHFRRTLSDCLTEPLRGPSQAKTARNPVSAPPRLPPHGLQVCCKPPSTDGPALTDYCTPTRIHLELHEVGCVIEVPWYLIEVPAQFGTLPAHSGWEKPRTSEPSPNRTSGARGKRRVCLVQYRISLTERAGKVQNPGSRVFCPSAEDHWCKCGLSFEIAPPCATDTCAPLGLDLGRSFARYVHPNSKGPAASTEGAEGGLVVDGGKGPTSGSKGAHLTVTQAGRSPSCLPSAKGSPGNERLTTFP